jgi:hypothetical protein
MNCPICELDFQPGATLKAIDSENILHRDCYTLFHYFERLLVQKRFSSPIPRLQPQPRPVGRPCGHFWVPFTMERDGRLSAERCDRCKKVRFKNQ